MMTYDNELDSVLSIEHLVCNITEKDYNLNIFDLTNSNIDILASMNIYSLHNLENALNICDKGYKRYTDLMILFNNSNLYTNNNAHYFVLVINPVWYGMILCNNIEALIKHHILEYDVSFYLNTRNVKSSTYYDDIDLGIYTLDRGNNISKLYYFISI